MRKKRSNLLYLIPSAAKARGWRTGLVATSRLTHATPASFSAHVSSRASEFDIAKQQVQKERKKDILERKRSNGDERKERDNSVMKENSLYRTFSNIF